MELNAVTIVIPSRNEERYIADCIKSIMNLDYPSELMEILIVDGQSTDKTVEIVKDFQNMYHNLILINNPHLYTPHALNIGIKNATKDYILIASAHSVFSKNYLKVLMNMMKENNYDGVGGILITKIKNINSKTLSICKVLSNKFGVGNSMFRVGTIKQIPVDIVPFGLYKKKVYKEVGLYNEYLLRNQDMEFSKRLLQRKMKIYLVPEAQAVYYARESFSQIAKNNFSNGFWIPVTVYITKKINSLSVRHFVPLLFILTLILSLSMSFKFSWALLFLLIIVICYAITIAFVSIRINNAETRFYYIFWSFLVLHFSYGFGSLIGLFRLDKMFKRAS